ncbi:Crp/Fnr family transcriptional regulator [Chryseobacterium sp. G0240]|uniref:Crp/Fnr family transcriptional regulator n=1 Tax=Chryseobacterium sp. G0240 TaxID=2487066 RepID=UPI000F44AC60|nr:Crp/Fnr family transcriptional regulator [Chryseobacterium sp. G0240]ROI04937.1 Crp/Fnr family transcriptional regulator [Chryseobacterium sp. G0240]
MIPEKVLKQYGCIIKEYECGDFIYEEGMKSSSYFQILSGKVKLNNFSEDDREFIQNIFEAPQSFGEVLLFIKETYPTNAIALTNCSIFELPAKNFFTLLKDYPQYSAKINENLSRRLHYKMVMSQHIFSKDPGIRLKALMDYFKHTHCTKDPETGYLIPLTRQQMADLTGLRVETVIRTIKAMEKDHLLKIKNRQIYY